MLLLCELISLKYINLLPPRTCPFVILLCLIYFSRESLCSLHGKGLKGIQWDKAYLYPSIFLPRSQHPYLSLLFPILHIGQMYWSTRTFSGWPFPLSQFSNCIISLYLTCTCTGVLTISATSNKLWCSLSNTSSSDTTNTVYYFFVSSDRIHREFYFLKIPKKKIIYKYQNSHLLKAQKTTIHFFTHWLL